MTAQIGAAAEDGDLSDEEDLGGCGEGGAFVSRRPEVAAAARLIRVHGSEQRYHHSVVGANSRMDGFQARSSASSCRTLGRALQFLVPGRSTVPTT